MKPIIIVKPKSISSKDKEKLSKDGNIVIEQENSTSLSFRQLKTESELIFELCITCAERIYMTREKREILLTYKRTYYCSQGHSQCFK